MQKTVIYPGTGTPITLDNYHATCKRIEALGLSNVHGDRRLPDNPEQFWIMGTDCDYTFVFFNLAQVEHAEAIDARYRAMGATR